MKVGIYGQFYHEGSGQYIRELLEVLQQEKFEVVIEKQFLALIRQKIDAFDGGELATFETLDQSYDFFFSIGGDGTLLKSVTYVKDLGIPIVGINTGRLGFLSTIHKSGIRKAISSILQEEYTLVDRSVLEVQTSNQTENIEEVHFALNEIVVNRKNSSAMLSINVWVDGEFLNVYWADGLIVSSPTGSTGYSMSCGGPIVAPAAKVMTLTAIAPHNLNVRPIVVPDTSTIMLKVSGRNKENLLSMDSRITTFTDETQITVKKAPFNIKLVLLDDSSFIQTLRKKLLWGEDKRNR